MFSLLKDPQPPPAIRHKHVLLLFKSGYTVGAYINANRVDFFLSPKSIKFIMHF